MQIDRIICSESISLVTWDILSRAESMFEEHRSPNPTRSLPPHYRSIIWTILALSLKNWLLARKKKKTRFPDHRRARRRKDSPPWETSLPIIPTNRRRIGKAVTRYERVRRTRHRPGSSGTPESREVPGERRFRWFRPPTWPEGADTTEERGGGGGGGGGRGREPL